MDLAEPDGLPAKVERLLAHHNALRRGLAMAEVDDRSIVSSLREIAPRVLPFMDAVWRLLDDQRRAGKRILFEGAQGAALTSITAPTPS